MRTSFPWLFGALALVSIGFLMACGSHFSSTSDGLVIVPNVGSATVQAFSFVLSSGHSSQINTAPAVPGSGQPSAVVVDPSGGYAYVGVAGSGVASYKINSDGTLTSVAATGANSPVVLAIDSAGKFLFSADGLGGGVSVFSIGSGGSLAPAATATLPTAPGGATPNAAALAISPTIFPAQSAACSGHTAPTSENLYVADSTNNVLYEYAVDATAGTLTLVPTLTQLGVSTGTVPSGVAVDPCNRFVYVANGIPNNNISAFSICSAVSPQCLSANGGLLSVSGSPFPVSGIGPGPLAVDPLGNFLYVVSTPANILSGFKISAVSGSLTALSPATIATGSKPVSIAIRGDDNWLFVANYDSANVSQFSITPATGALNPTLPITTDNNPTGVAVK